MNEVRRIVTRTSTPAIVGPNVSQWAYGLQPYVARGIHVQVRCERGRTHVEAVDADTGALVAAAAEIVSLQKMDSLRAPKSAVVAAMAAEHGITHRTIPLAA